ncbi:MAG: N-acetylmuramoyl-L-alanine amidase [Clostridia bacterium]|nr:N-acetylmuramoyl-L-alanine amidase [Clostridia bacterium]
MGNRLKRRLILLAMMSMGLLVLAVAPRPAQPAIPARPVQQSGGPLDGHIILVDAGHGGSDGGARAKDSGTWEKDINLQTALALQSALAQSGAQVLMTRESDMEYDRNKRADLTARLDIARQGGADLLISVHMNEYRSRKEAGPQVFYRKNQEQSRLLAGAIQAAMIRILQPAKKRAAMAGDYFMLSLDIPSVLVECGFLSNSNEEALLLTEDYRQKVAQAVTEGVIEYISLTDGGQTAVSMP